MDELELEKSLTLKHCTQLNQLTKTLTSIEVPVEEKLEPQERGKWSWEEELLYYRFIKANKQRLNKQSFTKKYCKFTKMSEFIGTKTVSQCRSHFQKTVTKFSSLDLILQYFEGKLGKKSAVQPRTKDVGVQTQFVSSNQFRSQIKEEKLVNKSDKLRFNKGQNDFLSIREKGERLN